MADAPDHALRGRTRAGRLALFDAWLLRQPLPTPTQGRAVVLDIGFGKGAATLRELAESLSERGAGAPHVIGLERDDVRVAMANEALEGRSDVVARAGGFDGPLQPGEAAVFVRCMNVLRGYPEAEVPAAHRALVATLVPGGFALEGSSHADGELATAWVLERGPDGGALQRALLFATDGSAGVGPWAFRDVLPRDLRRHCRPGSAIEAALRRWHEAFVAVRGAEEESPLERLARSVERLGDPDWEVLRLTAPRPGVVVTWRQRRG